MSAANPPSAAVFGLTLTPPAAFPSALTNVARCVPAGMTETSGPAASEELHPLTRSTKKTRMGHRKTGVTSTGCRRGYLRVWHACQAPTRQHARVQVEAVCVQRAHAMSPERHRSRCAHLRRVVRHPGSARNHDIVHLEGVPESGRVGNPGVLPLHVAAPRQGEHGILEKGGGLKLRCFAVISRLTNCRLVWATIFVDVSPRLYLRVLAVRGLIRWHRSTGRERQPDAPIWRRVLAQACAAKALQQRRVRLERRACHCAGSRR